MQRTDRVVSITRLGAALGLASSVAAQQPSQPANVPSGLQPVESTIGDVGPLRMSLRELRADLRVPTSFDTVYRLPAGTPGSTWSGIRRVGEADPGQLARVNGAVTAVFPRSIYNWTGSGPAADVPPGTVYLIGGRSAENDAPRSAGRLPGVTFVDTTAPTGLPSAEPEIGPERRSAPRDRSQPLNVFTDDDYRAARVQELLSRAAAGHR